MDVSVELRLLDSLSGPARQAFGRFRAAARQAGTGFGGLGREAAAAGQAVDRLDASARAAGEATADMGRDGSLRRTAGDAHDAARGMDAVSRSGRRAGDALRQAEAQAGRLRRTLDGVGRGLQNAGRVAGGLRDAGAAATAAGMLGAAALAAPVDRERQYLSHAILAFDSRGEAGIKAGVAELRALDQRIAADGGGTLDSARALSSSLLGGGMAFEDVARLAPTIQKTATAAAADSADMGGVVMAALKNGQFSREDVGRVLGMMLSAGASGSFEARDMAQYLPSIFSVTGDMRGLRGTAQHLAGLETIRDASGDSAEAANNYQNLLSFRSSKEAYDNLGKKGIKLAHVYSEAAKKGEDLNLAFVRAVAGIAERNRAYQKLKKRLATASGDEAVSLQNQMGNIRGRIFKEIIGDQQAAEGAIALYNGEKRYHELVAKIQENPEELVDKFYRVMTSSTQANLDRLANEWEKGMDRVLEAVKGPLAGALGSLAGGLAGGKAGALAGSMLGPVGTAVGGVIGAAGGSLLGSELGRQWYAKTMIEAPAALSRLSYDAGDPEAMQDRFRQLAAQAEAGKGPVQRPDVFTEFFAGLRDGSFGSYWDSLFGGGQARPAFADTGEGLEERLAALAQRDAEPRRQDSPEEWQARLEQAVQAAAQAAAQAQPLRVELHSTLELDGSVLASTVEERMIREAARR